MRRSSASAALSFVWILLIAVGLSGEAVASLPNGKTAFSHSRSHGLITPHPNQGIRPGPSHREVSKTTRTPSAGTGSPVPEGVRGKVILLDPGHNGGNGQHPTEINRPVDAGGLTKACDTTGTSTAAGYREPAFALDVALRARALLLKAGAKVILTRYSDTGWGPCINERAAIGNAAHADVAISIHADGGPPGGSGFHVIYPALLPGLTNDIYSQSKRLAVDLRASYSARTGEQYADYTGDRGLDERGDLGGLNLSNVPKVFIECANMRNLTDAERLADASFRMRIASAIASGLAHYLTGSSYRAHGGPHA